MQFLEHLPEKASIISAEEIAILILSLDSETQQKIMLFVPSMKNKEVAEFVSALTSALQKSSQEDTPRYRSHFFQPHSTSQDREEVDARELLERGQVFG